MVPNASYFLAVSGDLASFKVVFPSIRLSLMPEYVPSSSSRAKFNIACRRALSRSSAVG